MAKTGANLQEMARQNLARNFISSGVEDGVGADEVKGEANDIISVEDSVGENVGEKKISRTYLLSEAVIDAIDAYQYALKKQQRIKKSRSEIIEEAVRAYLGEEYFD